MRAANVCVAALLIGGVPAFPAVAQTFTRPLDELEASRRQRIEMDKRMARETAEQRRKNKVRAAAGAKNAAARRSAS